MTADNNLDAFEDEGCWYLLFYKKAGQECENKIVVRVKRENGKTDLVPFLDKKVKSANNIAASIKRGDFEYRCERIPLDSLYYKLYTVCVGESQHQTWNGFWKRIVADAGGNQYESIPDSLRENCKNASDLMGSPIISQQQFEHVIISCDLGLSKEEFLHILLVDISDKTHQSLNNINFSSIHFEEDINFAGFEFPFPVSFKECRFKGLASFERAIFHEEVDFECTNFESGASFKEAVFHKDAAFEKVEFSDNNAQKLYDFSNVTFKKKAEFIGTKFFAAASFQETSFNDAAIFKESELEGELNFTAAEFSHDFDLSGVGISVPLTISAIDIQGTYLLVGTTFKTPIAKNDGEQEDAFGLYEVRYGQLREEMQRLGQHKLEAHLFRNELLCRKKSKSTSRVNKGLIWLYDVLCRCGTNIWLPVLWFILLCVIGWGGYCYMLGLKHATDALHITFAHSVPGLTFTRIGYIDVIKDLCPSEEKPCFSNTWGFQIGSFFHSIVSLILIFLTGHTIRRQLRML